MCCLSWCQLTLKKNSAISEEGHVLTAYVFFLAVSLASMQIKSSWNPFFKMYSGLKLKIYIDPSTGSAGSAVKIKNNRTKGKIVLKTKSKRKKNGAKKKKKRKQRRRESNPVYLPLQATPWPLHHYTHEWHINFVISKQFFSAIDAVWSFWSCIYDEFKYTFEENST